MTEENRNQEDSNMADFIKCLHNTISILEERAQKNMHEVESNSVRG